MRKETVIGEIQAPGQGGQDSYDGMEGRDLFRDAAIRVMNEALHSGMWSMEFNEDGIMTSVHWSDEFRRMLGYSGTEDYPDELESWSSRLHREDREHVLQEFRDTIQDYTGRKSYDVRYRLETKSGEWRWYHAMGRLIRRPDGTPKTYVGMFVDITNEVEQEQRLRDALERAEEASKAKTMFLSHMSHDIRTPINGIMGMTNIALRHLDDTGRVRECLKKIDGSSHHLLSLINDVLDMSRIESGKVHINEEPFDLGELIADCSSIIQGQLVGREIDYSADLSGILHRKLVGDDLHLRQILINILGNSVKFTHDGDRISICVRELGQEDGMARFLFELSDTGIGMSKDFLPKLFDSFSQENGGSRTNYKGTGLGMAITKEFVELMNGTIEVESQLNEGTKFTIELPMRIDEEPENSRVSPENEMADIRGLRVLVAEDNDINMEIVTMLLGEMGVEVTQAWNGKEAVESFENSPVGLLDAILMDVMMPEMDGMDATRKIRAMNRPDAKSVPIIAATANAYEEDVRMVREAGMDAHIAKPMDIGQLAHLLQRLSKKYRTGRT